MSAFLLFTENDSFVAGIGPKLYLREDTWRLSGGLGYGNVQQKFYGIGATDPDEYVSMSSEVGQVQVQALYRVWTNSFVGPSLQYSRNRFRGEDAAADAVLEAAGLNYDYDHNTVPGLVVQWDTREDQMAPRKGIFVDANLRGASEDLGSTSSFQRLGLAYSQYLTLWNDPAHVLAWLATVETGFGDVPFDEYPDLGGQKALRGYVQGEFTDKNMMAAQVEYRWNAWKKLGLTGFFGVGKVFPEWDEFDGADWLPAGGVGLRYLVMPDRRMNARLDLAWGELGFNFYFSVGEAF
jgi:outer membrane protein assembly factor BamA